LIATFSREFMGILVTSTTIRCKALATKRSDSSPADGPPQAKDDKAITKKFMRVFRDLHLFRMGAAFGCGSEKRRRGGRRAPTISE